MSVHYHLEIILPPVENVEEVIEQIMQPFNENGEDEDGHPNSHAFWDWYVIGGRYSGVKLEAAIDDAKKEEFVAELQRREVTVSSLTCGKQEIKPADQIPMVDALWREFFPNGPFKVCPMFSHFNDQYSDSKGFPDILPLKDMPKACKAARTIIAGPDWSDPTKLKAAHMFQDDIYNGVTWCDTTWDGLVVDAVKAHKKSLSNTTEEHRDKWMPTEDWLTVTVDYHS